MDLLKSYFSRFLQLFDKNWHKLQFAIKRDKVEVYVDCEYVTQANIEPKGRIDVNGDIVMGKNPGGSQVAVSDYDT